MFFNVDDLREIINEMEIDGEKQDDNENVTDYTSEPQDDETPDNTDNNTENDSNTEPDDNDSEPEDYTQMNDSDDENKDDDTEKGSEDNSTDSDTENDSNTEPDDNDSEPEDYTQMNDEDNNNEDSSSDSDNSEDTPSSDNDTSSEDSENTDSDNTEGESDSSDNEDNSFENLKKIEAELFSNLTDEQIAIKNTELKNQYIDLYTTIGRTLVRINDVAKTDDNIEILKFVTDKLLELRDMIDFNITTAFNTRTYIENNIIYQQCLSTLNAISDILANTPSPEKQNIENDEYENSIEDRENTSEMENEKQLNVSDTSKMEESAFYFNDYL
mgnify:CR=1 FL=1